MPFKSRAQIGKMAVLVKQKKIKPGVFREFADATPNIQRLPDHVPGSKFVKLPKRKG